MKNCFTGIVRANGSWIIKSMWNACAKNLKKKKTE